MGCSGKIRKNVENYANNCEFVGVLSAVGSQKLDRNPSTYPIVEQIREENRPPTRGGLNDNRGCQ